ncbi:MAG: hypothetical protein HYV63_21935 [Candidatus Schekmanbacteria bacterium]|nr:hypothetical protein [Candidatus Schekmanbacteria bacterium]
MTPDVVAKRGFRSQILVRVLVAFCATVLIWATPPPVPAAEEAAAPEATTEVKDLPLLVQVHTFPAEGTLGYVAIGIAVPARDLRRRLQDVGAGDEACTLFGRAEIRDEAARAAMGKDVAERRFRVPLELGNLLRPGIVQRHTGLLLPPGEWRLEAGLLLGANAATRLHEVSFSVPTFGAGGLAISTPVFARSVELVDANEARGQGRSERTTELLDLGFARLAPFPSPVFTEEDAPELFYLVSGATLKGVPGEADLTVTYLFYKGTDPVAQIPPQNLKSTTIGQPLPIAQLGLPAGDYGLRLILRDNPSGAIVDRTEPMRIVAKD